MYPHTAENWLLCNLNTHFKINTALLCVCTRGYMKEHCSDVLVLTWTTHAGTDATLKLQRPIPDPMDTIMIFYITQNTHTAMKLWIPADNTYVSHSEASLFKSDCFQCLQKHKQTCTQVNEKQNSPLWEDSLLSATFLSAETMASEGTRGLSTYLGFLIGPAGTNRRYRENDRER